MKKGLLSVFLLVVCALCIPFFTACTGTGGTEIKGVRFTKEVYEVDLNVPINLTYNVYPNTAKNYNVTFSFKVDGASPQQMFTYERPNKFTIKNDKCPDVVASINIGEYSDSCIIRLKKYPTMLQLEETSAIVNAGGAYSLKLKGLIDGNYKDISMSDYNIEATSSNASVLKVDSANPLTILSTGISGKATITVKIKDAKGNYIKQANSLNDLMARVDLTVADNVSNAYAILAGQEEFLNLSVNNFTQSQSNTYIVTASSVNLSVALISEDGKFINNSGVTISVKSASPEVAQVTERADTTTKNFTINMQSGTARIEITSSATDKFGNPVVFVFYVVKN